MSVTTEGDADKSLLVMVFTDVWPTLSFVVRGKFAAGKDAKYLAPVVSDANPEPSSGYRPSVSP